MQAAAHRIVVFLCLLANSVPGAHAARVRTNIRDLLQAKQGQDEVNHLGRLKCNVAGARWVCKNTEAVTKESEACTNSCVQVWCESTDLKQNGLYAKILDKRKTSADAAAPFEALQKECCTLWAKVKEIKEPAAPAKEVVKVASVKKEEVHVEPTVETGKEKSVEPQKKTYAEVTGEEGDEFDAVRLPSSDFEVTMGNLTEVDPHWEEWDEGTLGLTVKKVYKAARGYVDCLSECQGQGQEARCAPVYHREQCQEAGRMMFPSKAAKSGATFVDWTGTDDHQFELRDEWGWGCYLDVHSETTIWLATWFKPSEDPDYTAAWLNPYITVCYAK